MILLSHDIENMDDKKFFMAEREGFEPSVPLRVQHLSRVPLSTAQPPLRFFKIYFMTKAWDFPEEYPIHFLKFQIPVLKNFFEIKKQELRMSKMPRLRQW